MAADGTESVTISNMKAVSEALKVDMRSALTSTDEFMAQVYVTGKGSFKADFKGHEVSFTYNSANGRCTANTTFSEKIYVTSGEVSGALMLALPQWAWPTGDVNKAEVTYFDRVDNITKAVALTYRDGGFYFPEINSITYIISVSINYDLIVTVSLTGKELVTLDILKRCI